MDISGPVNKITTAGTAEIGYIDANTRRKVARQEEGQHYHKGLGHFLFPSYSLPLRMIIVTLIRGIPLFHLILKHAKYFQISQ